MNDVNPKTENAVGVEVASSVLKAVSLNPDGTIAQSAKFILRSGEEISEQLIEFVSELKSQFGEFQNIGVAVPGLLNKKTNFITLSKHIPENTGVNLADEIAARTGLRAVLENDANAAAYGEYALGAGRGSRDVFYVTLGTGVGGAFIFNGELWRGASGFAGEIGYIPINSDGMTLEEVASAENIVRRVKTRVHQDSTSSLAKLREAIDIESVVRAANAGDGFAGMMLERTGEYVGTAIANVINVLNIGTIVVGGEVMQTGGVVLEAIKKSAAQKSFVPNYAATRIMAGELGEFAAAVGAALLAKDANVQNIN